MTHDEMIAVIAAHRDGRKVMTRRRLTQDDWVISGGPCWDFKTYEYRIAPETKRVPLGPDDFPPGTVVRKEGSGVQWMTISWVIEVGVHLPDNSFHRWDDLRDSNWYRILPGSTEWLPC